ncbi:uncharacterized protein BO97DRAFT_408125 [Aspergillus homomorphus CBS 101889]|uniref:Uncharacterized protein n=1 Tax=Aspergillus homomorphus (strain CBS 101889) TaxID=1450537 RepID=A0A395HR42_ASPHC|nr:hypothetical protein BO97DRAFT_408125 [Aspergillus homomorphus CBS 101889]RAL08724.1 hypothetical protein BO97DRAFT_408125 [Aspergillus homomorphus CBS 101889]
MPREEFSPRLATISNSPYATYVRAINIRIGDSSCNCGGRRRFTKQDAQSLTTSLSRLCNIGHMEIMSGLPVNGEQDKRRALRIFHSILQGVSPKLISLCMDVPFIPIDTAHLTPEFRDTEKHLEPILPRLTEFEIWQEEHNKRPLSQPSFATWVFGLIAAAANPNNRRRAQRPPSRVTRASAQLRLQDIPAGPSPPCLQTIDLGSVSISARSLAFLLAQSKHLIWHIVFEDVRLIDGGWQDILAIMAQMPNLEYCRFDDCSFPSHNSDTRYAYFSFPLEAPPSSDYDSDSLPSLDNDDDSLGFGTEEEDMSSGTEISADDDYPPPWAPPPGAVAEADDLSVSESETDTSASDDEYGGGPPPQSLPLPDALLVAPPGMTVADVQVTVMTNVIMTVPVPSFLTQANIQPMLLDAEGSVMTDDSSVDSDDSLEGENASIYSFISGELDTIPEELVPACSTLLRRVEANRKALGKRPLLRNSRWLLNKEALHM